MSPDQKTDRPLGIGIVGLSGVGTGHLKAYQKLPNVRVLALADVDPDRLADAGTTYSVPHLYQDYNELATRGDVDAVSVCVPNHLHAPISIAALQSGKHVLCEKPLARSGSEAENIVHAAIEAGRVLKVMFNHRHHPDVEMLKRYIESDGLGRIYYAKAFWLRRRGIPGLGSWFTNKEMAGGGPLIDLGVHMLDMVLDLLGEPQVVTVSANTYAELGPLGHGAGGIKRASISSGFQVEDLATAFMRLAGGGTLALETSWATHRKSGDEFGVTLYGTKGGAQLKVTDYVRKDTLRIYTDVAGLPTDLVPDIPKGDGHGQYQVVRDFVEIIRSGEWSEHVGRDGLYRTHIIDACYESARQGRELKLDDVV